VKFLRRLAAAPARRVALGLVLAAAVVLPGIAGPAGDRSCHGAQCPAREVVRWSKPLTGSWIAENGIEGTVPAQGQAYAAMGHGLAVIGTGLSVSAFDAATGIPRWTVALTGLPIGSVIASVRAWPGVVTVGVSMANAIGGVEGSAPREEIVLTGSSGRQLHAYPSAASGGAVSASKRRTVVVGPTAVTSYSNATGKAVWRVPTGRPEQAWRVSGRDLYITVSAEGEIGTAPVTAVRQIDLRSGDERLIQPPSGSFDGTLAAVTDGELVFSGPGGLSMYQMASGRLTGQRADATLEGPDPADQILYVEVNDGLVGIDPVTGQNEPGMRVPGPPGTYGVLGGVALGLDAESGGDAWGYSIADRRVIWTVKSLPWPHYFVDLSGLGGSADQASGLVLLLTCGRTGSSVPGSLLAGVTAVTCLRPRLVVIGPSAASSTRA